jgi:fructosamine-3-kinase
MEGFLKNIIKKYFGVQDFSFEEVSDKGDARVFIVNIKNKKYVVRIVNGAEESFSLENNIFALKELEGFDVAPGLISSGTIGGVRYSIESFLKGAKKEVVDISFLKKLRKVHSITSKKCGYVRSGVENWRNFIKKKFIVKGMKSFLKYSPGGKEIIDYLVNCVPKCKNFSLLHGDLSLYNILFNKKDSFLFDFEDCFFGDKNYDLGYFYYMHGISDSNWKKIEAMGYDKKGVLYYALCVFIWKISKLPKGKIKKRIIRLKEAYEEIKKL